MKETDDGTKVDVSDVGSIPTTSTKTLLGRNVHGVKTRGWAEWLLPERISKHGGDLVSTRRSEILEEDADT